MPEGSLRTECSAQKFHMDSSILQSHFAAEVADARKEEMRIYLGGGDACAETQTADGVAPRLQRFLIRGGARMFDPFWRGTSSWTHSAAKRIFDIVCVLLALPVVVPILLAVALAVRLTSQGPILFLQERAGMNGRNFTIFKFRTMEHAREGARQPISTLHNQRFTPVGPFLRRLKLDELPQLGNVLLGHMSLVGPRPQMPQFIQRPLPCRPGVTGAATIAFAQEAIILARVPRERLTSYYSDVVAPAKRQMDAEYLAQATFFSDLGLLIKTALRQWNPTAAETFITAATVEFVSENLQPETTEPSGPVVRMPLPIPAMASRVVAVEQATLV
jgi:lipopolysaccharide/colanic/teichoic acid biosynthesis glycosyltransferase